MLFVAALAATCVIVPSAGAVLVHTGNGHVAGVMLRNHVNPKSLRGSFDKQSSKPTSGVVGTEGDVNYNGGPVLHATTPYLIFWDPSGNPIASGDKTLLERFFNDVAADSGKATNQYSVLSQYGDGTGSASYNQTWSSAHAINDTHAYPAPGQQCTENAGFIETACLFDSQIQTEVQNEISLHSLPTGLTGSAPIYFVVLPPDVNSCFADDMTCADNFFCAYHSSVLAGGNDTTYANISLIGAAQGTTNGSKGCQFDGNDLVQAPNSATAGDTVADVAISYMSHEDSETITDPLGNAWFSDTTGNEVGDNCAFSGPFDPADGENPDAWLPTLGGTADAGNLFDEVINTNPYYTQTEWSNGNDTCEAKPQPIAGFSASASTVSAGSPVSFNASASTEPGGSVSSYSWNFGDGATGSGITPSHAYSTAGTYTVTLTVTGDSGNTDTTSNTVTVHGVPTARVSATGSPIGGGTPEGFSGAGSTDTGSTIASYSWNFGDGTFGSGAAVSHQYGRAGTFTATLTVTDASGATSSATTSVKVAPSKITKIKVKKGKTVETISVTVNGAGTARVGSKSFSASGPKTLTIKVKLSKAQRKKLKAHHSVTLRVKLKYTPAGATSSTKTVTIKIKG